MKPELRDWLQERHVAVVGYTPEPEAIERTTAANPKELPKEQAAVAYWISKKYKVAAEPIAAIVAEAFELALTATHRPHPDPGHHGGGVHASTPSHEARSARKA